MMEEYEDGFFDRFLSGYFPGICLYAAIGLAVVVFVLWLK